MSRNAMRWSPAPESAQRAQRVAGPRRIVEQELPFLCQGGCGGGGLLPQPASHSGRLSSASRIAGDNPLQSFTSWCKFMALKAATDFTIAQIGQIPAQADHQS